MIAQTSDTHPAEFRIVAAEDEKRVLFTASKIGVREWHDFEVDLEDWAAGDIRFVSVSSAPPEAPRYWGSIRYLRRASPSLFGFGEPAERPNVILISLDTLRADQLSWFGNRVPVQGAHAHPTR